MFPAAGMALLVSNSDALAALTRNPLQ